jgi:D-glycero-D-manno-heptose 1,7-bisphosphate phosphatase
MAQRAVFLDRDGVINEATIRNGKPYPPASVEDTVIVQDAAASLKRLKQHGFLLCVVTNQPDVRRGTTSKEAVARIHEFLFANLPLDDVFVCYHDDDDRCGCRKPLPGLLLDAAAKHGIDLTNSYLIGDRWRDVGAGTAAGCSTVLIDRHYQEPNALFTPSARVNSLSDAVTWILGQELYGVSG